MVVPGAGELQLQPLVPEDISMSVYEKFVPIFAQKAQELTLQLPDTALPSVFADEQRLEQILSILLDNAHSYAPEEVLFSCGSISVRKEKHGSGW